MLGIGCRCGLRPSKVRRSGVLRRRGSRGCSRLNGGGLRNGAALSRDQRLQCALRGFLTLQELLVQARGLFLQLDQGRQALLRILERLSHLCGPGGNRGRGRWNLRRGRSRSGEPGWFVRGGGRRRRRRRGLGLGRTRRALGPFVHLVGSADRNGQAWFGAFWFPDFRRVFVPTPEVYLVSQRGQVGQGGGEVEGPIAFASGVVQRDGPDILAVENGFDQTGQGATGADFKEG